MHITYDGTYAAADEDADLVGDPGPATSRSDEDAAGYSAVRGGMFRPLAADTRIRQIHHAGRLFSIDEITVTGPAEIDAGTTSGVVVVETLAGRLDAVHDSRRRDRRVEPGQTFLVSDDTPWCLRTRGATLRLTTVTTAVLRRTVAGRPESGLGDIRFSSWLLSTRELTDTWCRSAQFVTHSASAARGSAGPLLDDACARVLAATVLTCFRNDSSALYLPTGVGDAPAQLRRAMSYIDRNAGADISVQDVATAVHLSSRAVQYLFRRHLDITPSDFLRRIRLSRAHGDLVRSEPSLTTVAVIAHRWGFSHTGRFAVMYRETYGQSPHVTLRE